MHKMEAIDTRALLHTAVAIICGIIFGSIGANLINVDTWSENKDDLTREFTRTAIAIQACLLHLITSGITNVNMAATLLFRLWRSVLHCRKPT